MTYRSPRSDVLREDKNGRTVAGVLYFAHELRRRLRDQLPHVQREDIRHVINALHDLEWECLLRGQWVKLGRVGRIHLCVRSPYVGTHPATGEDLLVPQLVDLRGTCSPTFKGAYYEHEGVHYPDDPGLDDGRALDEWGAHDED